MITVTAEDGEPVRVVLLIPDLTVPYKLFSGSSVKGKFVQSGSGDASTFISTVSLPSADLAIYLSDWSLDVECRLKKGDQDLKYKCRQFPGQIVPSEAKYEVFLHLPTLLFLCATYIIIMLLSLYCITIRKLLYFGSYYCLFKMVRCSRRGDLRCVKTNACFGDFSLGLLSSLQLPPCGV
uniref:IGv domain-containing protein n=1 Tax=Echinococcus granulosus TaxID=6210 RepID=A0A068X3T9_ECHGR|nr:hypothetical protein EgrG_000934600 [Echinococcus granulosus]